MGQPGASTWLIGGGSLFFAASRHVRWTVAKTADSLPASPISSGREDVLLTFDRGAGLQRGTVASEVPLGDQARAVRGNGGLRDHFRRRSMHRSHGGVDSFGA